MKLLNMILGKKKKIMITEFLFKINIITSHTEPGYKENV